MNYKIINLSYLKMVFTMLYNGNNAVTITTPNGKPMPFEEWINEVHEETDDWYGDLKEYGVEELTISYESGLELTFKL
ncbi:MAG: hypothetical protein SNH55_02795 [Rikenellaceae bacterium]